MTTLVVFQNFRCFFSSWKKHQQGKNTAFTSALMLFKEESTKEKLTLM